MMNEHMTQILQRIRRHRESLQYSQEYMAAQMKMGQNCYSKIELGHSKLTVERLLTICDLLKLEPGRIITSEVQLYNVK